MGQRLGATLPQSFVDVNTLRTDLQHDVDHGKKAKLRQSARGSGTRSRSILESRRLSFWMLNASFLFKQICYRRLSWTWPTWLISV